MKNYYEVKDDMKKKAQGVFQVVKEWCSENKEVIIALAPTMIAGSIELIKIAVKGSYVKEEKRLKDMYIYDRTSGHYYELCRKPTNKEWLAFEEIRFRNLNARTGEILKQMGLIK